MSIELYTGTEAVSTTEHSCTTDTAGPDAATDQGEFRLVLDLSDMVAGDELQIRCYEKCRSGDTQRIIQQWTLVGAQSYPIWVSPPMVLMHGWDFTLDAIAGTITVLWSIRQTPNSEISAAVCNKIADHTLRRSWATAGASSDGDAKSFRSLLGAVAKLVNKFAISGATATVYEADDSTSLGTQTVGTTSGVDPITSLDTA